MLVILHRYFYLAVWISAESSFYTGPFTQAILHWQAHRSQQALATPPCAAPFSTKEARCGRQVTAGGPPPFFPAGALFDKKKPSALTLPSQVNQRLCSKSTVEFKFERIRGCKMSRLQHLARLGRSRKWNPGMFKSRLGIELKLQRVSLLSCSDAQSGLR